MSASGTPKRMAASRHSWDLMSSQASRMALPAWKVDREEVVVLSKGVMAVSTGAMETFSRSMDSAWAAICGSVVVTPWPISVLPAMM